MPRFDIIGFGGVKSSMEPLPAGDYKTQITKWEERAGKEKGTKYINWILGVVEHPEYSGRNLFFMTMLEPKEALFKLKKLCESVGGKGSDAGGFDPDKMVGEYVKAKVVQVTNSKTGEPRNEVVTVDKV